MGYNWQAITMKKHLLLSMVVMASTILLTSCFGLKKAAVPNMIIPIATNTINSVGLSELNLKHGTDYTVLNTVTAEATILYTTHKKGREVSIKEENGEFEIRWKYDEESREWYREDFEGIARYGFLSNDYARVNTKEIAPEDIVRNLAIYRLINQAKVRGVDGVIEPVISTNAEASGKNIIFKTTVSAKLMKLNADAK